MVEIVAGSTDNTLYVYFVDDDGGTAPGEPTTGKLFSDIETGGSASYARQGATRTDFTLVTQTAAGAHTDGGFVLVDDTNMPGLYRVDVPDAAFATGADFVIIHMVMASANNSIMRPLLVQLRDNPSVNVAQWLSSAVPALVGGRLDASVGAMASNVLAAAAIAADAVTKLARGVGIQKNTAKNDIPFLMIDSADDISGKTGLTITATVKIDAAAFVSITGTTSEAANGLYKLNASAADFNGDIVTFRFTGAGANDTFLTFGTVA